jgi:hypothetical protein
VRPTRGLAYPILSTQMRGQEMPIFVMVETQEDEDFSEEVAHHIMSTKAHVVCGACVVKAKQRRRVLRSNIPGLPIPIRCSFSI